jgi:FkbM family methyltransferase
MFKSLFYLIRKIYWRLRALAETRCDSAPELQYRLNRLPLGLRPGSKFQFPWGLVEYVSAGDLRGQFTEIFVQRHYAFKTSEAAPVIVDAGGNVGMSALWFKREHPKANLTVYEADPALAAVLSRNLAAAGITDVNVQHAAVWDRDGTVSFDNRGQDKGLVSTDGAVTVRSVDLALHLPPHVDLLKLDIEGAEYGVIRRLSETGALTRVRNLVAEFHIKRTDLDDVLTSLRLLRESGMEVTLRAEMGSWLGDSDKASPFEIIGRKQVLAEVYAWRP